MPLIPDDKIAEIRDRTNIVQVVGELVALKRSGVNWKGLCPFHAEKTPSFNVNEAKQMFHCFGCGKSGDVIRFLMEHDGKGFIEVVRELAKRAGVDLPEPEVSPAEREAKKRAESDRARMLKLNRMVCDWFREQYAAPGGARARAYVEDKRGVSAATREAFAIGFAPPGWDALVRFLEAKRVPHELAEAAGLVRPREHARLAPGAPPSKATHFDLFRDRVMFPLLSAQSEVIAFSGRALEDAVQGMGTDGQRIPKYINSPETILYKKGEQLYGVHLARAGIRKAERAILVEGNFDVLMMHERGFSETVAPMGTALTAAQVRLLARSAPRRVYMLLDGDAAGSSAAARNVGLFLDEDQLSFVALLPAGDDPDTFVRRQGREALELLLSHARESVEYFCEYGWGRTGASVIERARLLEEEAAPIIRKVKIPAARQRYAERLAKTLDLPHESVLHVLRGGRSQPEKALLRGDATPGARQGHGDTSQATSPDRSLDRPLDRIDQLLVALVLEHPRLLQRRQQVLQVVEHPALSSALDALMKEARSATLNPADLAALLPEPLRKDIMAAALQIKPGSSYSHSPWASAAEITDPERTLESLRRRRLAPDAAREIRALHDKLAQAAAAGDQSKVHELTARINEIHKARLGLKG